VHVGQDDMSVPDARLLLGRTAIIGLSVSTLRQAQNAPLELLDYVGVGAVFASGSKDDTSAPIGISGLREIVRAIRTRAPGFPICGISGINAGNAAEIIEAGADGVAVISALSLAPDPEQAALDLRAVVDGALKQRRLP
jgi:thiamine-phosphate pyrophosphorylase